MGKSITTVLTTTESEQRLSFWQETKSRSHNLIDQSLTTLESPQVAEEMPNQ
jgi:hypothetical protein